MADGGNSNVWSFLTAVVVTLGGFLSGLWHGHRHHRGHAAKRGKEAASKRHAARPHAHPHPADEPDEKSAMD